MMTMSGKCLVVFYSKGGNTKAVAQGIAKRMSGDICEVSEQGVVTPNIDPSGYDLVVVGTPVNGFQTSQPIQGYLRKYGARLTHYAIYATYSLWPAGTLGGMEKLVGKKPIASVTFKSKEIILNQIDRKVDEYVASLKK